MRWGSCKREGTRKHRKTRSKNQRNQKHQDQSFKVFKSAPFESLVLNPLSLFAFGYLSFDGACRMFWRACQSSVAEDKKNTNRTNHKTNLHQIFLGVRWVKSLVWIRAIRVPFDGLFRSASFTPESLPDPFDAASPSGFSETPGPATLDVRNRGTEPRTTKSHDSH